MCIFHWHLRIAQFANVILFNKFYQLIDIIEQTDRVQNGSNQQMQFTIVASLSIQMAFRFM